jgi:predicted Ser/Thr protein kinase
VLKQHVDFSQDFADARRLKFYEEGEMKEVDFTSAFLGKIEEKTEAEERKSAFYEEIGCTIKVSKKNTTKAI